MKEILLVAAVVYGLTVMLVGASAHADSYEVENLQMQMEQQQQQAYDQQQRDAEFQRTQSVEAQSFDRANQQSNDEIMKFQLQQDNVYSPHR